MLHDFGIDGAALGSGGHRGPGGLVGGNLGPRLVVFERLREYASRHILRLRRTEKRQQSRCNIDLLRLLDPAMAFHTLAVHVDDAFHPVVLLADPSHVSSLTRIIVGSSQLESVIGQDDQGRVVIHDVQVLSDQTIGIEVHFFHRLPVLFLLLGKLTVQFPGAKEMPEKMGDGVGSLNEDHVKIGTFPLPQIETDPPIAIRGCEGPLEVTHIRVEIEGTCKLIRANLNERTRLFHGDFVGTAHQGLDPIL